MIPYCLQATFFISFVCSVPSAALTHSVGSLPAFNILLRLPQRQHPGATHKSSPGSCLPSLLFPPHKAHASPVKLSAVAAARRKKHMPKRLRRFCHGFANPSLPRSPSAIFLFFYYGGYAFL